MPERKRKPLHAFSAQLCTKRLEYGLTQQDVADYLCRSRRWYQKIEAGTSPPNWQDTILLIALFKIDAAAFAEEAGFHVPVSAHSE